MKQKFVAIITGRYNTLVRNGVKSNSTQRMT